MTPVRSAPVAVDARVLGPARVAAVIAAIALLLLLAGSSIWLAERTSEASRADGEFEQSRGAALAALLSLERAETGQRGFLLTGDDRYLQTYGAARTRIPAELDALRMASSAAPVVPRMREIATAKLAEMDRTIELYRSGRMDDSIALVRTDVGQSLMDEYRRLSDEAASADRAELARLLSRMNRETRLLVALDSVAVLLVFGLSGLLAAGVRRALTLLRHAQASARIANAELEQSNGTLEDAVRQRTADLTLANDEIQRFAYIVSHDLRSPLVNIMGFTSELEVVQRTLTANIGPEAPEPVREALQADLPESIRFIKTSTAKMDGLIGAILRLSREGRRRLTFEPLDMTAVLQAAADTMAHEAQRAGATIVIDALPPIVSDRVSIGQVFGNLLENALKYGQPGRPVSVRVGGERRGAMARFEVADDGRGIAARDLDRVFDLFRRAGDQSVPGDGIGLAHVRALVRRLGGTIACRSELGVGSTFVIDLPVRPVQGADAAA